MSYKRSRNYETIRIHKAAYDRLRNLSIISYAVGMPKSMTAIVSEAILAIPEPETNGSGNKPVEPTKEDEG